jgi:outer membrane immunogenic protein
MKNISLVAIATAGFAVPALAADFPAGPYTKAPPPIVAAIYDWSGFYIGANGGWGGDSKCWGLTNNLGTPVIPTANAGCSSANGGVAGGQIGYRWQAYNWVLGLEAQGDWAGLKGSNVSLVTPLVTNQSEINAFGLFTAHIGYAFNNALFYVKGGAAVTADKYTGLRTATGLAFDSANESRWGGAAGAGVEYGFAPNWSVAVEYDHLFMGNADNTFLSTGTGRLVAGTPDRIVNIHENVDMVTARVNYHFGYPALPRY